MARYHPLQASFAFGEISPRLLGRVNTERYKQSLRVCENVLTFSHGNAVKRPGTRFLVQSPTEGAIRLFDLQSDLSQPYVVELGWRVATGGYIRLLNHNGYAIGSEAFITNGGFSSGLAGWIDNSQGVAEVLPLNNDYARFNPANSPSGPSTLFDGLWNYIVKNQDPTSGQCAQPAAQGSHLKFHYIDNNGTNRTAELQSIIVGNTVQQNGMVWTIDVISDEGTFIEFTVSPATTITNALYTFTFSEILTSTSDDAILEQQITVVDPTQLHNLITVLHTDAPSAPLVVNIGTTQGASDIITLVIPAGELTQTFTPGAGNTTFWISIVSDGAFAGNNIILNIIQIYDATATLWEEATPYSEADIDQVSVAESTQNTALYFTVGAQAPHVLIIGAPGVFSFAPVVFVNAPPEWAADNYPHAITFFQQRLWLAGTNNQPDTIWGSHTNDFFNFDVGTGVPTEAIAFEMSDRGVIEWIQGSKDLLIGADVAEYILTSSSGVIQPGDILVRQQSAYGSSHQEPQEYANGVLYVGNDLRRVRFMKYQFLEEGWLSTDITWPSEHITRPLIKEMHFTYAPDPIIWMVMHDGTAISAIYERDLDDLVGWHRHPFPEAFVMSSSLTKLDASTEVWFAMKRTVDGTEVVYIERTEATNFDQNAAGIPTFFSDCSIISNVVDVGGVLTVSGLGPLEAFEVQILINGSVHPPQVVVGGLVTLATNFAKEGEIAIIGIGYTGKIRTLPLENVSQGGSSQAKKKRFNRIFVRLLNSAIPVVNGNITPARFPMDPMDASLPMFTGDIQISNLGWDRFAQIEIDMPLPLPYNILTIFGDADSGDF